MSIQTRFPWLWGLYERVILRVLNSSFPFWLILSLAFRMSYRHFRGRRGFELQPDVQTYKAIALGMTSPYDTSMREPIWIWLSKVALFFSAHDDAMRWLGILSLLGACILLYFLIRDMTNRRLPALLAMFYLGTNWNMVDLGVQGLRDAGVLFGVTGFAYFALVNNARVSLRNKVFGLTLFMAITVGTRITLFAPCTATLILVSIFQRIPWRHPPWLTVGPPIAFTLFLMVPHCINNQRISGDPLFSANVHATWWRNYEFVYKRETGCAGCPSKEEFMKNGYAGTSTTAMKFLFGMHTPSEVLIMTAKGFGHLLIRPGGLNGFLSGSSDPIRYFFYCLGFAILLAGSQAYLALLPFLFINFLAFSVTIDMPYRLFSVLAPFHASLAAIGATGLWVFMTRIIQGRSLRAAWKRSLHQDLPMLRRVLRKAS